MTLKKYNSKLLIARRLSNNLTKSSAKRLRIFAISPGTSLSLADPGSEFAAHGDSGARAYNGGLGAEAQRGSQSPWSEGHVS